jgi:predicted aspartyl protease
MIFGSIEMAWAADDCPPLTTITSVEMKLGDDDRPYVPVKINDASKSLLIDTGGFFTELSESAAEELHLNARRTRVLLVGVSGDTTQLAASASLAMGNLRAEHMDFMLMPSVHELASDVKDAAGILAPNFLRPYDADFDFGGNKFNLISQKHCDGKVVYWPADSVAVVPVDVKPDGHIVVPVELDGEKLDALLDTGASTSVLNLEVAEGTFGLKPGSSEMPVAGNLFGKAEIATYSHRFKSLSLEGLSISNPTLRVIPDLVRTKMLDPHDSLEGETRIKSPDVQTGLGHMILGMDILRQLHVYVAYKEEKLYITPAKTAAGPGAAKAPTPLAAETKS